MTAAGTMRVARIALIAAALTTGARAEETPPVRLVTLAAPVTETVYALGFGDRVVGVDLSSEYPAAVKALPRVGYHRALSAEGVLSLRPGRVLGTVEAGPPEALRQLRAAGVAMTLVPAVPSAQGARDKITAIAAALGVPEKGRALVATLDRELDSATAWIAARNDTPPRVLFIYARGQGALSVSGRGTAADAMIGLSGGVNAVTGYEGYKPLTPEALAAAHPDVIVMTSTGLESAGGTEGVLRQPGVSLTPAGKNRRLVALDDELLLGFGPRLGRGVFALARALRASHVPHGTDP